MNSTLVPQQSQHDDLPSEDDATELIELIPRELDENQAQTPCWDSMSGKPEWEHLGF